MDKFTTLTGVAAPMKITNVDTDMIIPKQYLKTIARTGLGKGLFAEMRYREDGSENPDFVLNKPAYRRAQIIVAEENFGCGSSREHAPWALLDFGIRCVISTSFADIFYNNCFKNGILPVVVSPEDLEKLMDDADRGSNATLTINLEAQEIRGPDGGVVKFEIDPHRKHCLLNGLDDIGLTMEKAAAIDAFEKKPAESRPWACCHSRARGNPEQRAPRLDSRSLLRSVGNDTESLSRLAPPPAIVDGDRVLQPLDLARAFIFPGNHLAPFRRVEALGGLARFPEIDAAAFAVAEYVILGDQARRVLVGREILLVDFSGVFEARAFRQWKTDGCDNHGGALPMFMRACHSVPWAAKGAAFG